MCTFGASYSLELGVGSCQSEFVETVAGESKYKGTQVRPYYVVCVLYR